MLHTFIYVCDHCNLGKYERGAFRNGVWVFGGMERGTNRCFLVPVKNRKASTLIPIIKRYIRPGATILSDCWLAYKKLKRAYTNCLLRIK